MRRLLAALAALVAALLVTGAVEAAGPPRYEIAADVDVARARVDATQRTTYTNDTGGPLANLVFSVTPAYYEVFTLRSATVGGQNVTSGMDGTVLDVKL